MIPTQPQDRITIWRTSQGLLVFDETRFRHIDPTGAIVATYGFESMGLSARSYYVEDDKLWAQLVIATVDDIDPDLVLDGLVVDDDPETLRFVETVLGDAAVSAEAAKPRDA